MQKRKVRAYKMADVGYKRAMRRAKKEKIPLARMVEEVLIAYGDEAYAVHFTKKVFPPERIKSKPSTTKNK